MRPLQWIMLPVLLTVTAVAAEQGPLFSSFAPSESVGVEIVLTDKSTGESTRVPLGGSYEGYTVGPFDPVTRTVVLSKPGSTLVLRHRWSESTEPAVAPDARIRTERQALLGRIRNLEGQAFIDAMELEIQRGMSANEVAWILRGQRRLVEAETRFAQHARDFTLHEASRDAQAAGMDPAARAKFNQDFERSLAQQRARRNEMEALRKGYSEELHMFKLALEDLVARTVEP